MDNSGTGAAVQITAKDGRAMLIHVSEKHPRGSGHRGASAAVVAHARAEESMRELSELARTAGVEVVDSVIQLRD